MFEKNCKRSLNIVFDFFFLAYYLGFFLELLLLLLKNQELLNHHKSFIASIRASLLISQLLFSQELFFFEYNLKDSSII